MTIGTQADFVSRIQAVLPPWFPDFTNAPVFAALINGVAVALTQVFSLQTYVRLQTRITTATDGWLDLIALDYFGSSLPRYSNEADSAFRQRIRANLFVPRATRAGMSMALVTLTGRAPIIFEPGRAADAFCLGHGGLGYGKLGSYTMNNQAFITAYRPQDASGANIAGLGSNYAGLGSPYLGMPAPSSLTGQVTDANIYALIDATKPTASVMWTQLLN